eukprot:6200934-Pleurochrysis_carterae.AAC.3
MSSNRTTTNVAHPALSSSQMEDDAHFLLVMLAEEISRKEAQVDELRAHAAELHYELLELRKIAKADFQTDNMPSISARTSKLEEDQKLCESNLRHKLDKLDAAKLQYNEKKHMLQAIESSNKSSGRLAISSRRSCDSLREGCDVASPRLPFRSGRHSDRSYASPSRRPVSELASPQLVIKKQRRSTSSSDLSSSCSTIKDSFDMSESSVTLTGGIPMRRSTSITRSVTNLQSEILEGGIPMRRSTSMTRSMCVLQSEKKTSILHAVATSIFGYLDTAARKRAHKSAGSGLR